MSTTIAPDGDPWPEMKERHIYVDTIFIWVKDPLTQKQIDDLDDTCGSIWPEDREAPFDDSFQQWVSINQPSEETYNLLQEKLGWRYMINHVAVAFDIVFERHSDMERMLYFYRYCLALKWPGKLKPGSFLDSGYSKQKGKKWSKRNWAWYPDTTGRKRHDGFSAHLELRLSTAEAVRRYGFRALSEHTPERCVDFLRGQLATYDFIGEKDVEKIGRQYYNAMKGTDRRKPWYKPDYRGRLVNMDRRAGYVVLRREQTGEAELKTVAFVKSLQKFKPRNITRKVDASFLLDGCLKAP